MTSHPVIRIAEKEDASQVLQIYQPFIESSWTSFEEVVPTVEEMWGRIEKTLRQDPWIVYDQQNQICGYAYAGKHRERAAYRWNREVSVYVHHDHYNRGIGRVLYHTLFRILQKQGYQNVLAGIVEPNAASIRFHKALGFKLIGTYHNIGFKLGKWWDVNWYEKFIGNPKQQPEEIVPVDRIDVPALVNL